MLKKGGIDSVKKLLIVQVLMVLLFALLGCDALTSNQNIDDILDRLNNKVDSYDNFTDINLESSYLGYGYNIVTSPYIVKDHVKMFSPILDQEKIKSAKLKLVKENNAYTYESEGSTMVDFMANYSQKLSVYGKYNGIFSGGVHLDFEVATSSNSYYYFYKSVSVIRTFDIYITDSLTTLKTMLDEQFEYDLMNMDPNELLDTYGTHMLRSVYMGGRTEINSIYTSQTVSASATINASVNAHIKASKTNSLNVEQESQLRTALSTAEIDVKTNIRQLGGKVSNPRNLSELDQTYLSWTNSFNEDLSYSALSGVINEDSLLPIWMLVPNGNASRANEIQEAFESLLEVANADVLSRYQLKQGDVIEYGPEFETPFIQIRDTRHDITDSGRYNQHYDQINFLNTFGINLNFMKEQGYKTIDFLIEMRMRELDDGYQYIFLYSHPSKSDSYLIETLRFEHTPGKLDENYWWHYSDELKFRNIPISNFSTDFVIRYGASGDWGDTWRTSTLNIKLIFKK